MIDFMDFYFHYAQKQIAFVARGFLDNFGVEGVIAFLILGPMMDLKI